MIFFLTLGDVLLTPADALELAHLPDRQGFLVGLLSGHGGRTNGHKLLVTTERLSRFFSIWVLPRSIHPIELNPWMFDLCGVPGLLTDDFNA